MRSGHRQLAAAACAFLLASAAAPTGASAAPAPAAPARPLAGLRVLLTNDDSMQAAKPGNADGLGLYELRRALCAAGADVVVIAPWQVQSGRGTAVTNGGVVTLAHRTQLPAGYQSDCSGTPSGSPVHGLCLGAAPCGPASASATPADTVKFALRAGLADLAGWTDGPDLVATGINSGPNVSAQVNDSGTVGAALAAVELGVPAVAFSTAGDADNLTFPLANYRATADYGARLIAALRQRSLLSSHFALKVDHPDVTAGRPVGAPRLTTVGEGRVVWHAYQARDSDSASYDITYGRCSDLPGDPCTETRPDADSTALLRDNRVSLTPVTPDRTLSAHLTATQDLLRLRHFVDRQAPRP
ncbi:5'/3'-nucleotidase SurE [Kitasatospora sp. NPDC001664]